MNSDQITFFLGIAKAWYISHDEIVRIHEYEITGS